MSLGVRTELKVSKPHLSDLTVLEKGGNYLPEESSSRGEITLRERGPSVYFITAFNQNFG